MDRIRNALFRKKTSLGLRMGTALARFKGAQVGTGTKIALTARLELDETTTLRIGDICRIHHGVILAPHRNGVIEIGDQCSINPYCVLYGHGGLRLGNRVRVAAHCTFIPANHRFAEEDGTYTHVGLTKHGITIGSDVWIGTGVRVLDGVTITDRVTIGAGSVVTKSIRSPGVYAGVPARLIRENPAP